MIEAQHLKDQMGDGFYEVMRDRIDPPDAEPALIHERLFNLNAPLFVNTNYDGSWRRRMQKNTDVTYDQLHSSKLLR